MRWLPMLLLALSSPLFGAEDARMKPRLEVIPGPGLRLTVENRSKRSLRLLHAPPRFPGFDLVIKAPKDHPVEWTNAGGLKKTGPPGTSEGLLVPPGETATVLETCFRRSLDNSEESYQLTLDDWRAVYGLKPGVTYEVEASLRVAGAPGKSGARTSPIRFTLPKHQAPDPEFVQKLRAEVTGIYFTPLERLTPGYIEREFRQAANDLALLQDNGFMQALFFVVRKKEIPSLRPDLLSLRSHEAALGPDAHLSFLKSIYALGTPGDREWVDLRLAKSVHESLENEEDVVSSPFLRFAERIGGSRTLAILEPAALKAARDQREAERKSPTDHLLISRLDRQRSGLEQKVELLRLKGELVRMPEEDRRRKLTDFCLRKHPLAAWAYLELRRTGAPLPPGRAYDWEDALDAI